MLRTISSKVIKALAVEQETTLVLLSLIVGAAIFCNPQVPTVAAANLSQTTKVRFAVIGDYGTASRSLNAVAMLIKSWNPDFIITVGDNNYPAGSADTIDRNIGQYFGDYIYPYWGTYTDDATTAPNRFFPAIGDHDMSGISCSAGNCSGAYLDYFTLPGNERYYDFARGPVHFFMLNSDKYEPDGNTATSVQANWLREKLTASVARWKIVIVHQAPYSSCAPNPPELKLRWPYAEWGASLVLSGNCHSYERLLINRFPYLVNGAGGNSLYDFGDPTAGSIVRYNEDYGALQVEADKTQINFRFYNRNQQVIDSYTLPDNSAPPMPASSGTVNQRIVQSRDDVEERIDTGLVTDTSSDLEMTDDLAGNGYQSVGLRFLNVNIPQAAVITSAYIEFVADESDNMATNLAIHAHALDNSPPFALANFNLTTRLQTSTVVEWPAVLAWTTVGGSQRTPDLRLLVQEVVNRSGWQAGNALSFHISGAGRRTAVAYDGNSNNAPRLQIEWSFDSTMTPTATPTASIAGADEQSLYLPVIDR